MRFNDASVSRKHLRICLSENGDILVEDLASSNGTLLNGEELRGAKPAKHGDIIKIGSRELQVLKVESEEGFEEEDITLTGDDSAVEAVIAESTTNKRRQRCPECSGEVSVYDDMCASCGYSWGDFRPQSKTVQARAITPTTGRDRRRDPRHKVQVPLIYSSETLAIESHAIDLSRSGVFVRTNLLDPVGTACSITILVDGAAAINLDGSVCRVVEVEESEAQPLGLGIQFHEMSEGAQAWLSSALVADAP